MFYINDELIDYSYTVGTKGDVVLRNEKFKDDPIVQWIANGIHSLKKELPMIIEFPSNLGVRNASGIVEYPQSRPLRVEETLMKFGSSFTIRWSERARRDLGDKGFDYSPRRSVKFGAAYGAYNGSTVIDETKVEWAFFLKEVSKQRNLDFIIRDEVAMAKEKIETVKRMSALYSILPDMPNSLDDEKIKVLAEAYGIGNADAIIEKNGKEEGLIIIRNRLYDILVNLEKRDKNAIKEFIERSSINEITKTLSLVNKAINSRVILISDTKEGKFWRFSTGENICQSTGSSHELTLANYLMKNKSRIERIKELLGEVSAVEEDGAVAFVEEEETDELVDLRNQYREKFGKNPAPKYTKDAEWMKNKLNEE